MFIRKCQIQLSFHQNEIKINKVTKNVQKIVLIVHFKFVQIFLFVYSLQTSDPQLERKRKDQGVTSEAEQ